MPRHWLTLVRLIFLKDNNMKYEVEPNAAWLLTQAESLERVAGYVYNKDIPEISDKLYKARDHYRKEARKLLRGMGFERDCEIDQNMITLAIEAANAIENLSGYIGTQSPKIADHLAKHGDNELADWQKANPSPIRPKDD